ncbi:Uncharacterized protein DBV15_07083 [Temnothorax longispinosus]|uniref:Adenosine kinase n=1 Tax=Temnothorax longispinosus TaxID=300112 RepID=A0A4V3SBE6_9HYME|nr:Uncharacterized protein DBV15_07083 [Temnothorax longispinosus]
MAEDLREGLLLGIGNPLLDISANIDHEFLQKYDMKPNNAILAEEKHKPLYEELIDLYNASFIAGGSVQNTMRVAQWFLQKPKVATYMGCVGRDKYSKILEDKAVADGLNVRYQYTDQEPTGTCAVLITGKERSLCANLAAANCFSPPESIQTVAKHAHENDKIFMMNLSAPFLCEFFQKPMLAAFPYVDILFGNETEAEAFAKANNLNETDKRQIALKISEMEKINDKRKRIVVITQGAEAVLLAKDGTVTEYPVVKVPEEKIVDTNTAGDAFVGGFLAQLIQGKSIDTCIKCGIWAAAQIVQTSGCTYEGKPNFQS